MKPIVQPNACCLLPIAHCLLPTAHCPLPIATAYCLYWLLLATGYWLLAPQTSHLDRIAVLFWYSMWITPG